MKTGLHVKTICIPPNASANVYLAIQLARRYADRPNLFPGIRTAKISVRDCSVAPRYCAEYSYRRWSQLWLGCNDGDFSNEFTCAEALVKLIIDDHAVSNNAERKANFLVKRMKQYCQTGINAPLNLRDSINSLSRLSWQPDDIEKWLSRFLDCYLNERVSLRNKHEQPGRKLEGVLFPITDSQLRRLTDHFKGWLEMNALDAGEQRLSHLAALVKELDKRGVNRDFSLAECAAVMSATDLKPVWDVIHWVNAIFQVKMLQQEFFLEACRQLKLAKRETVVVAHGRFRDEVRLVSLDLGNDHVTGKYTQSAIRFLRAGQPYILVQHGALGNAQIFFGGQYFLGSFAMLVRAVRLQEQLSDGLTGSKLVTDFDRLISHTVPAPGADRWTVLADPQGVPYGLVNGSPSRPTTPPTNLCPDDLIRIAKEVILWSNTPEAWENWVCSKTSK